MNMLFWSRRAAIGCAAGWCVMVTIYVVLGAVGHEVLPPPFNGLIMVTLSTATIGSLAILLAAQILARLEADGVERRGMVEAVEARDGRLHYEMARMRGEVAQLRERIERTEDLSRPALALVGEAYDSGYADGLAREPMAKVLQIGPRGNGS